ncbi:MAG: 23S rRNA (guanosine(2251)-2'-O)-methyltransferase RlmB [Thermodesulfovibrionales bacterium]|nr:23S rRNA (guanosine(2251)-2'-O)-methyltransferase RlmB [Thermodesulfovibrionales bacterium]
MKIKRTERTGRSRSDSEWIYGLNPVLEAIRAGRNIKGIFLSLSRQDSPEVFEIKKEAERRNISLMRVDTSFFHAHFPKGHQGIAAKVLPKIYIVLEELLKIPSRRDEPPLFILLDCIEDPRNFGAILRVADAAGVHGIVIQSRRSVTLSSEVSKASAGAAEYVPVSMVANIKHAIQEMKEKGITVIGAEVGVERVAWDLDLKVPLALVIGSEGKGIRKTVKESCDFLVSLPMKGRINSLNVSVAVGILAFEILRQRLRSS